MKATKVQVLARTEEIVRLLLAGARLSDIREYVSEKAKKKASCWHVPKDGKPLSDKQLGNYARRATDLIAASTKEKRRKRIERHLAQRQFLYAKAVAAADYRTALAVLKDEAELKGLYPPKGLELTGKGGAPLYPPLEAMVAALMKAEQDAGAKDTPEAKP